MPIDKLRGWLEEKNLKQADLARALNVTPQSVSGWFRGVTKPDAVCALGIERVTGIPASEWMSAEQRVVAFGEAEPESPEAA